MALSLHRVAQTRDVVGDVLSCRFDLVLKVGETGIDGDSAAFSSRFGRVIAG